MTAEMFNSTTVPLLEQTINFAQARHHVLAGNIANLDTPGYRVRDLSVATFQQRLKDALESRRLPAEQQSPGMIAGAADNALRQAGRSTEDILYHDDSNVGLEQQITEIAKNQAMHNMAISLLSSQFRLLQAAISERV